MKSRILLVLVALVALAGWLVAQQPTAPSETTYYEQFLVMDSSRVVAKAWVDVCKLNRAAYPNSNLVQPGDILALPLGKTYVVQANEGKDHMWRASVFFTSNYVMPYLGSRLATKLTQPVAQGHGLPRGILVALVVVLALLFAFLLTWQRRQRRPFVAHPPKFETSPCEVTPLAQEVLQRVYGRNFQILGDIVPGLLNGQQVIFFANGTHREETYHNEPGFRARLRFEDGSERDVYARWACFNPVYGATGARFRGTFTPEGGQPEEINQISAEQANQLAEQIRRLAATPSEPKAQPEATPTAMPEPTLAPQAEMKLTKLQVSRAKGLNLEGEIPLSVADLRDIIGQVLGEEGKES